MKTYRTGALVAGLATLVAAGCGGNSSDSSDEHPIEGYHYNGETSQGQRMTFSNYDGTIPLFEAKFKCGTVIGTTSLESVKIEKADGKYSFKSSANGIVGYDDGKPEDNGSIVISGTFSPDAKRSTGRVRVTTPRCDSGTLKWSAKAEPDAVR